MSESSSDLEFESADEDSTEQEVSQNEISNREELPEVSPEKSNVESEVGNAPSDNNEISEVVTQLDEIDLSRKVEDTKNDTDNKMDETPNVSQAEKLKAGTNLMAESSHRVPLRLEKKLQQKNQAANENVDNIDTVTHRDSTQENISSTVETKSSSSWGFSGWGTSLLSTAALSVSTFSSQVTQGIGTVIETVESTLGAPPPEELAAVLKERRKETSSDNAVEESTDNEAAGILPDMSAWTKVLENTGSKVLSGGLDTLELIGKKTMDILTEGDPGLRSKRHVFSDGVSLSQILREAKEKAEDQAKTGESEDFDVIDYSRVFDDQQGLIHLEALEMLSKQTEAKFQRLLLSCSRKAQVKSRLAEVKAICQNIPALDDSNVSVSEEFEDFESVFRKHVLELNVPLNADNIVKTQKKLSNTISSYESTAKEPHLNPDDIFRASICSLAEFTARCIETFHKIAELFLVEPQKFGHSVEECASSLTGLTTVMCVEINNLSSRLHKCLDSSAEHFADFVNPQGFNITAMVTNLYVEASNSNKYIQDAFQMLIPVLQVCLLESLCE